MLSGRRVTLRALTPADYGWLFSLSTKSELAGRWRSRPGTINPDSFGALLWQTVLCQFVIEHKTTSEPLGLVVAYQADLANGFAYIAVLTDPGRPTLAGPEAANLFIEYLFSSYPLRKLYGESSDYSLAGFASAFRVTLREEGRLRRHVFLNGDYRDWVVSALYREDWEQALADARDRSQRASSLLEDR